MNRTKAIRTLVEKATEQPFTLHIAGPNCSFNVAGRGVEYTVAYSTLTYNQKRLVCAIVKQWPDVVDAYITKSDRQHIRIRFSNRSPLSRFTI